MWGSMHMRLGVTYDSPPLFLGSDQLRYTNLTMTTPLIFSTFEVTRQAFHRTALAYAIVNLKPIVPGRTSAAPISQLHAG